MEVKLFWQNNPLGGGGRFSSSEKNARDLEDRINAWLSENPRIKIVDTKQSASGGSYGPSLWLISVWYEAGAAG
jgi:hypothetical protein